MIQKMKQIESIYMARIPGGAHFLFVNNVCERAEADAKVKVGAKAELEALRATRDEEDAALALSRKSLLSDTIREADNRRERLYVTLRNIVKAYPVEAEAAAAQRLVQLLKDYAINPRMQRDAETGLMVHLLDDLAGRYATDVATLHIGPLVKALAEVNELLRDTTDRRANERSAHVAGRLKKARKAADRAYRAFVRKVNALAVVSSAEDYAAFIDYVNTEVAHYRREVIPPRKKKEAPLEADPTSAPAVRGSRRGRERTRQPRNALRRRLRPSRRDTPLRP